LSKTNSRRQLMAGFLILGAGLDSFALRRRDLAGSLRVFEVDHPLTQQWKRNRISELNLSLPPHLVFVPVDFERQALTDALTAAVYQTDKPSFFSWLGVTQYLTPEAIDNTLREVSRLATGTEIALEYTLPEGLLDEEQKHYVGLCKARAAERAEPWLSFFTPEEMSSKLEQLGFVRIKHLTPEEAFERYFAGRDDDLPCPIAHRLITARV
jgi:methyltransferase (TIGR00027 family)